MFQVPGVAGGPAIGPCFGAGADAHLGAGAAAHGHKTRGDVTLRQRAIGRPALPLRAEQIGSVFITVNAAPVNKPPVANAGDNKNIKLPTDTTSLTGTGTDTDGTISAYQWKKISGPGQFTILSPTQAHTVINNLVEGIYQFELTVTDNLGAIGKDTVQIEVEAVKESNVRLFPNPATSVINIEIDAAVNAELTSIRIIDARGVTIYQEQFRRAQQVVIRQIDINKFANGFYFLEVITDKKKGFKFIKQ